MTFITRRLRRLAGRSQARFRRARPASVLILVVALLVLIALAGTALISTARIDRAASVQHSNNTQIDLLVEGVVRMTEATLVEDLYGVNFRQPPEEPVASDPRAAGEPGHWTYQPLRFENYDGGRRDPFLAPRVPVAADNANTLPVWTSLSSSLAVSSTGYGYWESPRRVGTQPVHYYHPSLYPPDQQPVFLRAYPIAVSITVGNTTQQHPGLNLEYVRLNPTTGVPEPYGPPIPDVLAADADGDGIADSMLWRLPVGVLNGVTYYAAVRIIDNGSALNPSVHWAPNDPAAALPGQFFTPNIDLRSIIHGATPAGQQSMMNKLNQYRFSDATFDLSAPPVTFLTAYETFGPSNPAPVPQWENGAERRIPPGTPPAPPDFEWVSPYDLFYHQLARRLDRPGWSGATRMRAINASDAQALAYKFIFPNPNGMQSTDLERLFAGTETLNGPAGRNRPYNPTDVLAWFAENFADMNNPAPNAAFSRRALWAPRTPVSNLAPAQDTLPLEQLDTTSATFKITTDDPQPDINMRDKMPIMRSGAVQTKASANTASFGKLWRAYWNVMQRVDAAGNSTGQPVERRQPPPPPPQDNFVRQFRNPLRDPDATISPIDQALISAPDRTLTPQSRVLLRAALAAVNTMDRRDSDTHSDLSYAGYDQGDVTSRRIPLRLNDLAQTVVEATVFGGERQVFITEIYVNNDTTSVPPLNPLAPPGSPAPAPNPRGYVAVELYNPTNKPVRLDGWQLGLLKRFTGVYPNMVINAFSTSGPLSFDGFSDLEGPGAPTIPAGKCLVLENYKAPDNADTRGATTYAKYRPTGAGDLTNANVYYVPDLHEVMRETPVGMQYGGELVLLRPRRGDGRYTYDPANGIYEVWPPPVNGVTPPDAKAQLSELVPVDSFDCSDFHFSATGTGFNAWHYCREGDPAGENTPPLPPDPTKRWKCVYPGRWQPSAVGGFRHEGVGVSPPWVPPLLELPIPGHTVALGKPDAAASYTNPFGPIQLANVDAAGPWQVVYPGANNEGNRLNQYPFGGFPRNGDLLQVTYIGAYRLRPWPASGFSVPAITDPVLPLDHRTLLELQSVTMDCALADDLIAGNDAYEQVGRFCPLFALDASFVPGTEDTYAWAADLFDYIGVQAPHDDYLPHTDPYRYDHWEGPAVAGAPTPINPAPEPTFNSTASTANFGAEDLVPLEGLININTAPERVLASIPWSDNAATNRDVARGIIRWRDGLPSEVGTDRVATGRGEYFKSLFDLYRVPEFRALFPPGNPITANPATANPGVEDGDLSPLPPVANGDTVDAAGDFEARFAALTRVSNLITTRSDGYTCYILVQGWRGAGGPTPELVVQRRAAFIADRSGVHGTNRDIPALPVPTN